MNIFSAVPLTGGLQVTTTSSPFLSSASLTIPLLLLMSGPPVQMVGLFALLLPENVNSGCSNDTGRGSQTC